VSGLFGIFPDSLPCLRRFYPNLLKVHVVIFKNKFGDGPAFVRDSNGFFVIYGVVMRKRR
jgi:hypothetical protein